MFVTGGDGLEVLDMDVREIQVGRTDERWMLAGGGRGRCTADIRTEGRKGNGGGIWELLFDTDGHTHTHSHTGTRMLQMRGGGPPMVSSVSHLTHHTPGLELGRDGMGWMNEVRWVGSEFGQLLGSGMGRDGNGE